MKKLTLLIITLALFTLAFADTYFIGTGTSASNSSPFNGFYDYSWSKAIWTAAELTTAGVPANTPITGIGFYVGNTPSNYTMLDQRIYVRTTALTSYGTAQDETGTGYPNPAYFLPLFQGNLTYNGGGWHYIMFTTPATWDGTSNLELLFENWDGEYVSGYPTFRYTSTSPNYMMVYKYQDDSFPAGAGNSSYNRPNVAIITPSTTPPEAPVLSLPVDGATGVNEYTTFSWAAPQTGSLPTGYKLYCDTNNPPTTLIVDQSALSYTLTTPLAYNTTYYWTVSAYNALGEGPQATVRSFTTRTDPTISTFPWVEDFGTTTNFPPLNWTRLVGLYPSETPTSTTSGWTYDDFANVVTTPPNMSARLNIWSTSTKYWLVTPPIAIPSAGYELKFDLALTTFSGIATPPTPGNQADDRFIVLISDNPLMTNPTVLREWNNTGSSYVYDNISPSGENQIISLNAYSGTKYIAFYGESTVSGGDNNIYVDNVTVRETPAAPIINCTPSSWDFGQTLINTTKTKDFTISNTGGGTLSISSITIAGDYYTLLTNPAPVDLTTGQTATFTVKYAPTAVGTHNGTVTITDNRGTTDVTLIGQCYDPTITAAQLPYTNSFEDTWVGTPPAPGLGWTVINANNDYYTWRRGPTYITAHTGSYIAQGMGNTNDWLITPPIQASIDLRIKWWDKVESASYPNTYSVLVSTTDNNIASFTNNLGTFTCTNTVWTQHTLNLDAFTGNTIYVAFHQTASASTYYDFGIDDFLLEEIPQQPVFNYSPTSINFGEVVQGVQVGPRYVTVTNIGGGTLILSPSAITIINDAGHNFSFDFENEVELSTGMSVNIPVYVTVHSEGPVSAILRINYADTDYDVALSATGLPTGIVVIGTGTEDLSLPIEPYYGYSYSQSIFLQSDIQVTNRYIEKIYYYWNGAAATVNSNNWTVYMGHTSNTSFDSGTSWIPLSELTEVFSGTVTLPDVEGWIEIELTTPFTYNNAYNLVIAVDENADFYDSYNEYFYCTSELKTNRSIRYYSDGTNPDPAAPPTGTPVAGYPNVMLKFQEETPPPLPVELSSFTAVLTDQFYVQLTWISQTETNLSGYRVYRNENNSLNNAILITPTIIPATNTSQEHIYTVEDREVENHSTYYYWLESIDFNNSQFHGPVIVVVEGNVPPVLPEVTTLNNAYPNPFRANNSTKIEVGIKAGESGTLTIYNIRGEIVKAIKVNEGYHTIIWDGKDSKGNVCGSGIYFYRLTTPSLNQTKKMVIVK